MRKIIVTQFITLDGVVANPHEWSFPYWTDEIGKFKHDELFASGAQLLGRVTYEAFAEHWPGQTDEYGNRLNSLPKYVVSSSLKKAEWSNSTILGNNPVSELVKLKEQPGQDILVHGSVTLVQFLLKNKLADQFNLLVFPLVLGKGLRLFSDKDKASLKLIELQAYSSGVVLLSYGVDQAEK
jgi:dihydrofolate reductase